MIGKILLNKYKILSELGEGGMSNVYLAEHVMLKRKYAVKMLADHLLKTPGFKDRFFKEGLAQAQLQHDNIVQVIDYIEEEEKTFLLMDYIEGECLDQLINRKGKLSEPECVQILAEILEALNFAHENGVIHRDIKPSNIIISSSGYAKLMDFGIAIMMGDKRMTATGTNIGTSWYMSPEHVTRPKEIDHRSDVYSIGIVLYEMLTGDVPFDGETDYEIKDSHLRKSVIPPIEKNASISLEMNNIVLKALAKNPDERFDGCMEFLNCLNALGDENKTIEDIEDPDIDDDIDEAVIMKKAKQKISIEEIEDLKTKALEIVKIVNIVNIESGQQDEEESYAKKDEPANPQSTDKIDNKKNLRIFEHMQCWNRDLIRLNVCIIILVLFCALFYFNYKDYYYEEEYVVALFAISVVFIICSYFMIQVKRRKSNPNLHPIYKFLDKRFESVEKIVSAIDHEIDNCTNIMKISYSTTITDSWILRECLFELQITNIYSDLVWIYKEHTTHYTNGVETGTSNSIKMHTRQKNIFTIPCDVEEADNIIQEISNRVPWVITGYNPILHYTWEKFPAALIAKHPYVASSE